MKALTIMQPWATLIARQVKTIETRPTPPNGNMRPDGVRGLPGLRIDQGERIAIHAAASKPAGGLIGDFYVEPWWDEVDHLGECDCDGGVGPRCGRRSRARMVLTANERKVADLPLGTVVATAVVADALPIVQEDDEAHDYAIVNDLRGSLTLCEGIDYWGEANELDITNQLPLGDFTPGRWGWLLIDVEPFPEPIPATGRGRHRRQ